MDPRFIVGFIDILGYSKIVKEFYNNNIVIRDLEEILKGATIGAINKFKKNNFDDQNFEEYLKNLLSLLNVRFISDSLIVTLKVPETNFSNKHFDLEDTIANCLYLYFHSIKVFCLLIIGRTSLVLRGGFSIGQHYEKDHTSDGINSLFIFSKSFIDAYELEGKAKNPRIVIDKDLWTFINEHRVNDLERSFYVDSDGFVCLDLYSHLQNDNHSKEVLIEIRKGIESNWKKNKSDEKIASKLRYFADYHNRKISEDYLKFNELSIRCEM
ncbi:MAG: hypothetical protein ACLQBC_10775 [Syntrophales bacterium]